MDTSSNIFSYFVGGLALISTVTSVLLYCRVYLPSNQVKVLEELLMETKSIYDKAHLEGLLPHEAAVSAKQSLELYEAECDILREITYKAFSSGDKILALFRGQTTNILQLAHEVGRLRSFLMTTSQKEKARRNELRSQLAQQGVSDIAVDSFSDNDINNYVHQPGASFDDTSAPSCPTSITVSFDELPVCSPTCACTTPEQNSLREALPANPPTQDFDAISRSSTLVHEPSAQRAWYLRLRWIRAISKGQEEICTSDSSNNHPMSLGLWSRWRVQTPQGNTRDEIACLPV